MPDPILPAIPARVRASLALRIPAALASLALCASAALAQPALPEPVEIPLALRPAPDGALQLDPGKLVQLIAVNNVAVRNAQLQQGVSDRLLSAEQALYVPNFFSRLRSEDSDRPRSTDEFTGLDDLIGNRPAIAIETVRSAEVGVQFKLPTGGSIEVSHQLRDRTSNQLIGAQQEARGIVNIGFKQPLLRGAGRQATEADLRVVELEAGLDRARFAKQLLDTAGNGLDAYWQLARAVQGLTIREGSVATLRRLSEDVRRRVEGGFAPRTELLDVSIAVSARQTDLVRAQRAALEAQSRVRSILNVAVAPGDEVRFAPTVGPDASVPIAGGIEERVGRAIEEVPAFRLARLKRDQEQVRLDFARNQRLPDLNLEFGYRYNSLADGRREAIDEAFGRKHPGWYVGLNLEMPLDNRRGDSRLAAQSLRLQQAEIELDGSRKAIANDVLTRYRQFLSAQREAELQRTDVSAREQLLEADRAQYALGRARLRLLLEREDELNESRLRLLDAEIRVELARAALMLADGSLLAAHGVTLEP